MSDLINNLCDADFERNKADRALVSVQDMICFAYQDEIDGLLK
jgi:hypothetical protein